MEAVAEAEKLIEVWQEARLTSERESSRESRTQRDDYYSQDEEKLYHQRPLKENIEVETQNKLKKIEKELEEARRSTEDEKYKKDREMSRIQQLLEKHEYVEDVYRQQMEELKLTNQQ